MMKSNAPAGTRKTPPAQSQNSTESATSQASLEMDGLEAHIRQPFASRNETRDQDNDAPQLETQGRKRNHSNLTSSSDAVPLYSDHAAHGPLPAASVELGPQHNSMHTMLGIPPISPSSVMALASPPNALLGGQLLAAHEQRILEMRQALALQHTNEMIRVRQESLAELLAQTRGINSGGGGLAHASADGRLASRGGQSSSFGTHPQASTFGSILGNPLTSTDGVQLSLQTQHNLLAPHGTQARGVFLGPQGLPFPQIQVPQTSMNTVQLGQHLVPNVGVGVVSTLSLPTPSWGTLSPPNQLFLLSPSHHRQALDVSRSISGVLCPNIDTFGQGAILHHLTSSHPGRLPLSGNLIGLQNLQSSSSVAQVDGVSAEQLALLQQRQRHQEGATRTNMLGPASFLPASLAPPQGIDHEAGEFLATAAMRSEDQDDSSQNSSSSVES
jgi:hypothetical protein